MKIAYVTNMKLWRGPVKYYNLIDIQIYAAIYILKNNNKKKKTTRQTLSLRYLFIALDSFFFPEHSQI